MKRISLAALLAASTLAAACGSSTEPIACTEELRAGITVTIVAAADGSALADGSTLTLLEGDYSETQTEAFSNSISGAWERAGKYDVTVERPGYRTWTLTDVLVTADECHVQGVPLLAELVAVS